MFERGILNLRQLTMVEKRSHCGPIAAHDAPACSRTAATRDGLIQAPGTRLTLLDEIQHEGGRTLERECQMQTDVFLLGNISVVF